MVNTYLIEKILCSKLPALMPQLPVAVDPDEGTFT